MITGFLKSLLLTLPASFLLMISIDGFAQHKVKGDKMKKRA